jgi:hypothetical protein
VARNTVPEDSVHRIDEYFHSYRRKKCLFCTKLDIGHCCVRFTKLETEIQAFFTLKKVLKHANNVCPYDGVKC